MTQSQLMRLAEEAKRALAEQRHYVVTWRGNDASQIFKGPTGFSDLASSLHINCGSLYNYICRGRGVYVRNGTNPVTGETDVMTIIRVDPPAKPKAKRGRPRTRPYTEAEMAAAYESGTILAPPARRVPKTRNRRTDEKQ